MNVKIFIRLYVIISGMRWEACGKKEIKLFPNMEIEAKLLLL